MTLKRNEFWWASINWTKGHYRLEQLCFTVYLVSGQQNHLGLKRRKCDSNAVKPHSIRGIKGSLMARVLNFCLASLRSICSHCFWPVVKPSDINWKLMKNASSICNEKLQLSSLCFTHYAQSEFGFTLKTLIL